MWHALWHMKLHGGNFHAAKTSQDMLYWKYGCKRNITLLPSSSNILWLYNSVTGGSCSWFRSQYWWISSKVKMWERKWRRNEKLFHYVLSIHNTRETQFGNRVSDEICRISKQKGGGAYLKVKKRNCSDHPSQISGVEGRKMWNSCTYLWCICKDRISCSGETLKSQTSAIEQTQWNMGHWRAPKLQRGQVCDPESRQCRQSKSLP